MKYSFLILFIVLSFSCSSDDTQVPEEVDNMYFPENNTEVWEKKPVAELGWDVNAKTELLTFLESKNTKSFMILVNGRIVIEEYFNSHTSNTPWYWASAGKTLTTAFTGIAEQEGYININNKVSDYIGTGWTSAPLQKENLITCRNLLEMTSGLDDGLGDNVSVQNLQYKADAGTRWAYHNVHIKLQDIVSQTTGVSWNNYFTDKIKTPIGMSGVWLQNGEFSVYWSNTRSMARFGLLALNNGKWKQQQIINNAFFTDAVTTSQDINKAYGYLWWLNGKESYHLPQTQMEFNGSLLPSAPDDMYMALGRDDQKIYVVPSKNMVIIRMGEAAEGVNFALSGFDEALWQKINALIN